MMDFSLGALYHSHPSPGFLAIICVDRVRVIDSVLGSEEEKKMG